MFGPIDAKFSTTVNAKQAPTKKNNLEQTPNIQSSDEQSNKLNTALAVMVVAVGTPLVIGAKLVTLPLTISAKIGKKIANAGQSTMAMKLSRSLKNFIFEKRSSSLELNQAHSNVKFEKVPYDTKDKQSRAKYDLETILSSLLRYPDALSNSDKTKVKKLEFYKNTVGIESLTLTDCKDIINIKEKLKETLEFVDFANTFINFDKNRVSEFPSLNSLSEAADESGNFDIKAIKKSYDQLSPKVQAAIRGEVFQIDAENSKNNVKKLLVVPSNLKSDEYKNFSQRSENLNPENQKSTPIGEYRTQIKKLEQEISVAINSATASDLFDQLYESLDESDKQLLSELILVDPVLTKHRDLNLDDMEPLPKLLNKEEWLELINLIKEKNLAGDSREEGKLIRNDFKENMKNLDIVQQYKIRSTLGLLHNRNRANQILSILNEAIIFENESLKESLNKWNQERSKGELFLSFQQCQYLEEAYMRIFEKPFQFQQ